MVFGIDFGPENQIKGWAYTGNLAKETWLPLKFMKHARKKDSKAHLQNGHFAIKDIAEVKTGAKQKNRGGKQAKAKESEFRFHTGKVVNKAGESTTTIPSGTSDLWVLLQLDHTRERCQKKVSRA